MPQNSQKKPQIDYLRYSGLAFQLVVLILAGAWLGDWLDGRFGTQQPYWTAAFSLLGVLIGMYQLYRDLTKN
jgi:F0F1-type ATP synthase assembly protein I